MKLRKLALAALFVAFATPATAVTYEFGTFLTGGNDAPTGTLPTFATLDIVNSGGTTYTFTLTTLNNFASTFTDDAYVGNATFNTDGTQGTVGTPILAAGTWGVSTISSHTQNGGSVSWDFGDDLGDGGVTNRLTSDESVSWTQTFGSALNLVDPFAMLHVQSLQGGDSGKYIPTGSTPPIPEPETYAMMLAGLGLLGFVARRRRQTLGNVVPA